MNSLALCALLIGGDPLLSPIPTNAPKLEWTIPLIGKGDVISASAVAISPDGALVAGGFGFGFESVSQPCQVAVYDRKTGDQVYRAFQTGERFVSMAFSRDNRFLAVATLMLTTDFGGGVPRVTLIDLKEKKQVKIWYKKGFVFAPTGDHLYLTTKTHIEVLELPGLKVVRKIPVPLANRLALSPDGKALAALHGKIVPDAAPRWDYLKIIDALTGKVTLEYEGNELDEYDALAFSPDGRRIATGHDKGTVRVWSALKNEKPRTLKVDTRFALFPLWLGNDALALFTQRLPVGVDKQDTWADMYRCDLSTKNLTATRWRFESAMVPAFSMSNGERYALTPDGKRMVAACNGITTIDLTARKVERTFPGWKTLEPKK